jgi:hypothetical protein
VCLFLKRSMFKNILLKFKMENYNPVMTPLLVNEKLVKEDSSGDADATQYKSLVGRHILELQKEC